MAKKWPDKRKPLRRHPHTEAMLSVPIEERRGVIRDLIENTWETLAVRGTVAELAELLEAEPDVVLHERDVLGKKVALPYGDWILLVQLKGHTWSQALTRGGFGTVDWPAIWLTEKTEDLGLTLGYEDTSASYFYTVYDDGAIVEEFCSPGDVFFNGGRLKGTDTTFKSKRRRVKFAKYDDMDSFLDETLMELDAYVALLFGGFGDDVVTVTSMCKDEISADAIERVDLVVYRKSGKPDAKTEALFQAIDRLDVDGVRHAIKDGADVNFQDDERAATPLGQLLMAFGHRFRPPADAPIEIATLLIEAGADPDNGGEAENGQSYMIPELARYVTNAIHVKLPLIRLFAEAGADVNARSAAWAGRKMGQTALHLAAAHNCEEAIKVLLCYGADLHATNRQGYASLDAIREHCDQPIVDFVEACDRGTARVDPTDLDAIVTRALDKAVAEDAALAAEVEKQRAAWEARIEHLKRNRDNE